MQRSTVARRWTVRTVAVLASASLLAACGGGSDDKSESSSASTGSSDKKVELSIGLFGTFGFKEAGLYDEYMKLHPNVTIKEQSVEQEQNYYQALQTRLAANSGTADIQGIEVGRIAEVTSMQADKWVDLKSLGADKVKDNFYGWKWDAATTKDGKTLALGTDTGPQAICFRKDLFQKAGLSTDRAKLAEEWSTWDKFIEVGKQYQAKAPAKSAFLDSAGSIFSAATNQDKLKFYDESGKLIYDTNPKVTEAWDLASKAVEAKITAKLKQFDPAWNQGFSNGAFATVACPAWMIGYIKGQAGDAGNGKWDVATMPGGSGNWGGSYLGIPKASKHQKEAYQLMEWLTAPEQQVKMWTKGQHFPSSAKAAEDPAVASATDAYFSNAPIGEIFGKSASALGTQVIGPKDGAIQNAYTNGIVLQEQQGKKPADALKATLKNIKQAIGS